MFSGIGGFELGIQRATSNEWECVGYSEIDKYAIQTYSKHFPEHRKFGDATKIDTSELPDFDFLCGGFPCQTFSIAGKRKGFGDTRGTMFFEIARVLRSKRPAYFLLENVKGLLNHDKGKTFSVIIQTLAELGYGIEWMVLNSKFFGVPQNRERVFIIGHLRTQPRPEVLPLRESNRVPETESRKEDICPTITSRYYQQGKTDPYIIARFDGRDGRQCLKSGRVPEIKMIIPSDRECYRVYSPEGIAPTVNSKKGGWQEPKIEIAQALQTDGMLSTGSIFGTNNPQSSRNIRRLTPTECARLQGFPDDWCAGLSDTQQYKCYGNAVTVNVIEAIVGSIYTTKKLKSLST